MQGRSTKTQRSQKAAWNIFFKVVVKCVDAVIFCPKSDFLLLSNNISSWLIMMDMIHVDVLYRSYRFRQRLFLKLLWKTNGKSKQPCNHRGRLSDLWPLCVGLHHLLQRRLRSAQRWRWPHGSLSRVRAGEKGRKAGPISCGAGERYTHTHTHLYNHWESLSQASYVATHSHTCTR